MSKVLKLYLDSFQGLSKEVWLLSFITLVNRSGTVVMMFLSIYLTEQLGFTKDETGIVLACFGIGALVGAFLGGQLTDRFGYMNSMFWSLFLLGFMLFGLLVLESFYAVCIGMFLTLAIGDIFRPASSTAIGAFAEEENIPRALSLYRLAINLGLVIGGAAAGFIAGTYGYKWLFIVDGTTCIVSALLLRLLLKEKPVAIQDQEKAPIKKSAYEDRWYLLFASFLFLNAVAFIQIFSTFPLFCREVLFQSEEQIGLLMAFNGLLVFILEMPIIYLIVRYKKETPFLVFGAILIGISYLIFNIIGFYTWVPWLFMVLFVLGEIINFPISHTIVIKRSTPANRGQYNGLYSMIFALAAIVSPWIGFKIIDNFGYAQLWYFLGFIALISAGGLLILQLHPHAKSHVD